MADDEKARLGDTVKVKRPSDQRQRRTGKIVEISDGVHDRELVVQVDELVRYRVTDDAVVEITERAPA